MRKKRIQIIKIIIKFRIQTFGEIYTFLSINALTIISRSIQAFKSSERWSQRNDSDRWPTIPLRHILIVSKSCGQKLGGEVQNRLVVAFCIIVF